jgi:hypothetical protein
MKDAAVTPAMIVRARWGCKPVSGAGHTASGVPVYDFIRLQTQCVFPSSERESTLLGLRSECRQVVSAAL